MQDTPTMSKQPLVPSPTSGTAPTFIAVDEGELASYSSTIVSLPPTVPELIRCLEQQHERHAQMTCFVERVRVEATKIAAASASPLKAIVTEVLATSRAAAPNTPRASEASTPTPSAKSTGASISHSPSDNAGARGVDTDRRVVAPGFPVVAGTVVRGTVLTGKVVSAKGSAAASGGSSSAGPSVPVRANVASTSAGSTPLKSSVVAAAALEAAPQLTSDELQVLRAKAIAADATEQLLACTQEDLKVAEKKLAREKDKLALAESRLAQLQEEMTATDVDASLPSQSVLVAQLQKSLKLSETALSDTTLKHQSAVYMLAQLKGTMAASAREKAFLEEKITHLEGQLHRLLMSSVVTASPTAPSPTQRSTAETSAAAAAATPSTSAQTSAHAVLAAPRRSASESYEKNALEQRIIELQSMTDKLTRDLSKQSASRAKAEETVQALRKEVANLKASALHFRRQVNESELELERAVSRKEEDERLRQLEREGNCLRTALRERTEHFLREQEEWEHQKGSLEARARVQEHATRQLLQRMLAFQVREVTMRQCEYAASVRQGETKSLFAFPHASLVATPETKAAPLSKGGSDTTSTPYAVGVRHAGLPPPSVNTSAAAASPKNDAALSFSSVADAVGAAADTATLVNRERQLEELKHTFERRVALVDAQCKAEVQQLHILNKELRAALAVTQEELSRKTRLLDTAQQHQQRRGLLVDKFSSFSANLIPAAPACSSSMMSEQRGTAASWVCHANGDGSPGASLDDLSDDVGGIHSTMYTPLGASPRQVTDVERRYDPERMPTWEAVQVENEALLDRLTTMQEEKWKLTSCVEDLQRQGNALKEELKRNASTMNQLLAAGVLTPAAVSRGSAEGSLRSLQCLLQETLQEKFALEERLRSLNGQL
ncbi:hypothetical protein ABL78_1594 [Leptomonas seymouri]|uniref:Uncharacterized protein n=1 Tax=Leptomonas seymouri TaxID=5684 RepID=A0A0N1I1Y9_LEPSE|nr:hypothetical protein ABL78_1594 [Leptomonas seymouri]|eukprot:KPI89261.1 hypothetical protein ABL78_1594 [Leptomonas seymouri]